MISLAKFVQIRVPADLQRRLGNYLAESRRPLTSLLFVLPLLVAYEVGVLVVPTTIRNGADAWMRRLLDTVGLGGYFLLPCLTLAVLLAWHHVAREPWRASRRALAAMLGESAGLALALVALAHVQGLIFSVSVPRGSWSAVSADLECGSGSGFSRTPEDETLLDVPVSRGRPTYLHSGAAGAVGQVVAFCGAGLYEEVLFRLLLFSAAARLAGLAGLGGWWKIAAAVASTSLLFALAHYVGAGGDAWALPSFCFRFLAGAFFALLFVSRGFGITAGTHAAYDVLVGVGV